MQNWELEEYIDFEQPKTWRGNKEKGRWVDCLKRQVVRERKAVNGRIRIKG